MSERDPLSAAVEALRAEFDASFAAPPPVERPSDVALLALRLGGEAVALRVHETAGLLKAGRIVPVPSRRPELLGIAGVRGAVIPVYSLGRLAGRTEGAAPRWIALAGARDRVGLAFAEYEGHVRVPPDAIHPASPRDPGAVSGLVEIGGKTRPILDVPAIVQAITGASDRRAG